MRKKKKTMAEQAAVQITQSDKGEEQSPDAEEQPQDMLQQPVSKEVALGSLCIMAVGIFLYVFVSVHLFSANGTLLSDGFESGDTSAWSAMVP